MSTSKQTIFTATSFMKYLKDKCPTITKVQVYFLRDKVLERTIETHSGWSDRPSKSTEYYFKPVLITYYNKDVKKHFAIEEVDEDYSDDWGLKFKRSSFCCLKLVHNVNMLEISTETATTKDGFEYYPAKTLLFKKHIKQYDALNDKHKNDSTFAFRKSDEDFDDDDSITESESEL